MPKVPVNVCNISVEKVRNNVKDLTALAGSNTTLTIYYTFNILSQLTFFLCQYGSFD